MYKYHYNFQKSVYLICSRGVQEAFRLAFSIMKFESVSIMIETDSSRRHQTPVAEPVGPYI